MAVYFEQADAPGDMTTPYVLGVGDVLRGTLATWTSDWVRVSLQAGQTYTFAAATVGAMGQGLVDPRLVLHGPTGNAILGDDDSGPGLFARFTYTPTQSGTYFLNLSSEYSGAIGGYALSVASGTMASFSPEAGAGALLREQESWAAAPATPISISWSFRASGPARDASGDAAPFVALTLAQRLAVERVLANYAEVADITFKQNAPGGSTNIAAIRFGGYFSETDGAGAYAYYPGDRGPYANDGDVWLNSDSVSGTNLARGTYSYFVIMHELGHAMGLDHPGDYNASPGTRITYANHAQFFQDSTQYTVMSYFDAWNTEPNAPRKKPDTLMIYDILALQRLYGTNDEARAGNSVYGFGANTGGAYDFALNTNPLLCIWDGGGTDVINLSGWSMAQRLDLAAGSFSDVGGFKGNLSIAANCRIENAHGGMGSDEIRGNAFANELHGRMGDDTISGGRGNDVLIGGLGADVFVFARGDGIDRIRDFDNVLDQLRLSASLWGGAVLSAAQVVATYAVVQADRVILDFGADEIHLMRLASVSGLDAHVLVDYL